MSVNRWLLVCALWAAVGLPGAVAQVGIPEALGRRITRVDVDNGSPVREREILSLFRLRPGSHYTPGAVQRGLQLLAQKPEIADVVVRGTLEGEDGIALVLRVEGTPLVYSIRFRGNRVLDDDELGSRLRTEVDRPLRGEELQRDRARMEERYADEGYPAAEVTAEEAPGPDRHWLQVTFHVAEGEPRRINSVEWPAPLPLGLDRANWLLGLGPGDPASERQLRSGVKRVVEKFHQMGYPEARAKRPRFDTRDGEVVAVPGLRVGTAIDVAVNGVGIWQARRLRKQIETRYGEPITGEWLEEVTGTLVEQLQAEGYHGAVVDTVVSDETRPRQITFQVDPGRRAILDEVRFTGNASASDRQLRRYMSLVEGGFLRSPPFSDAALARDLDALTAYYRSHGYLDARVALLDREVPPSGKVRLQIHADEGPRYRYGNVVCTGDLDLAGAELAEVTGLRSGDPADPGALERARRALLQYLAARGRARARVEATAERVQDVAEVRVRLQVDGGVPETFGQVVVSGNARTQTKIILRELTFQEGDLWNPQAVAESRRRIYRLGFFRSVRIEPLQAAVEGGVRNLRILVEEHDTGSLTLGVGYGTEEGVKGSLSLGHTNLQGYGRSLEFRAAADSLDQTYAVNLREPWLFNHPVDLRLSLLRTFQNREAYNLSTLGFQGALERKFFERIVGSVLYTLSRNRLSSIGDPETVESEQLTSYLLSAIGPVLAWDSRDDPFEPRRGFYHTATAEWALDALGSEVRYDLYTGSTAAYLSAGEHTLALYAGGGAALELAANVQLPVDRRFFLGGRNTVRGYQRDEIGPTAADGTPLGGDTMLNVKAEWRYPVWRKLGGVLFWDAGNVWTRLTDDPEFTKLRHGVGGGLRIRTPVGPLSLDVGWKLHRRSGEDPYVWHFTVGNVF